MGSDWVVLELGPKADGEDPDLIRQSIRHLLRDAEVFIPAMVTQVGEDRVVQYLLEGYAFIRRDHPDERYYRLEGSKYVQSIITHTEKSRFRSSRKIASVPETEVVKLRQQIAIQGDQGIEVGDTVLILSGPYRQIKAQVIEDIPEKDHVQVHVKFRSKEALLTFPRAGLRLVSKDKTEKPRNLFEAPREAIRRWLELAIPLSQWTPEDFEKVLEKYEAVEQVDGWLRHGRRFTGLLHGVKERLDVTPVLERWANVLHLSTWIDTGRKSVNLLSAMRPIGEAERLRALWREVDRLTNWTFRWNQLYSFVKMSYPSSSFSNVEAGFLEWTWLQDIQGRLEDLQRQVEDLEREVDSQAMPQNIIIDGNNLAVRCGKAPGLDTLKDNQGRPTGVIVGFLRSLASLRKRYPDATFYICWDGSSQRRKAVFPEYKSGRTPFDGYAQITWLRDVLPLLGIFQAFNEAEEADDVISTLIARQLADQSNLILSTDRDLFQLITPTTQILYPSIAGHPEKVYSSSSVMEEYGISPAKMVYFRAMSGDSSDKIPGVPRLPEKTIAKLLQMYGSVDGILTANLPELTKAQQEKIRASAAQIRKNVSLMTLISDLDITVDNPKPDRETAAKSLQDVDVKSDPFLGVFFSKEAPTHAN